MKKITYLLLALLIITTSALSFAASNGTMTKEEKDMCLLASKECKTEVDSMQKKIRKLNTEIKKGKKVYSAEEIKKLQQKLDEAEKLLDTILEGPGGS